MAKNIAYDSSIKESWIYYPGKTWELGIMTNNPSFEDEQMRHRFFLEQVLFMKQLHLPIT